MGAPEPWAGRLVDAAIRCYPAGWRRRHADEAAELAALLIRDGTPAVSIAWSYLAGAAREWLAPRPGRSLSTVAAGLLAAICLVGFSAALVAETVPAKAASRAQPSSSPVSPKVNAAPVTAASRSPRQLTPCRPVLPSHVAPAVPAAGRPQLIIQGMTHARSC